MGIKLNTERNKMDYYNIEAFDATGLVKTVFKRTSSPPSSGIRTLCDPSPMPMPG